MHPTHFYYFRKTVESKYGYTPTRDLDINRLIRNKAYWKQTRPATLQENKTLILADWTANNWSSKKRELVTQKLFELINDGFSIYIWQSGQVEALTKKNLAEFLNEAQMLDRMTVPAVPAEIEATAINEIPNLVKDQIQILDDYQINGLLQPEAYTYPRELDISEVLESKLDLDKLIPAIKRAKPPITSFIDNIVTEESYELLEKLKARLPDIAIKPHFKICSIK